MIVKDIALECLLAFAFLYSQHFMDYEVLLEICINCTLLILQIGVRHGMVLTQFRAENGSESPEAP